MRIDTEAKTFQWLGSFTSEPYLLEGQDDRLIILGTSTDLQGGWPIPGLFDASLDAPLFWDIRADPGILLVSHGTLASRLGFVFNEYGSVDDDPVPFSFTIEGDGTLFSYAGTFDSSPLYYTYPASFNGANLYFWIDEESFLAGSVEVVPEPSLALLLLPGMGLLWAARSRNKATG